MKKLLFTAGLFLTVCQVKAQPWMPPTNNGPVKYIDAVNRYRSMAGNDEYRVAPKNKEQGEEKNHLFEVWNYYWKRHLDKDGYMVPPARNVANWQQYLQAHKNGIAARTTSGLPSNWQFQGPSVSSHGYWGIGRINKVAFDPVESNTFYVGSAGSNTWKTSDGGLSWTSLYDNLPMLGVADIKINPQNSNTVFVLTGDADDADSYSTGVIVSYNAGTSWAATGLSWPLSSYTTAHCLLINPLDTNSMMVASTGGLFKTTDGGHTWASVSTSNFRQLIYNPTDTTVVYGTMYTDTCAQIMRSADGGSTWAAVTSLSVAQRINLAVTPADPSVVKAVVSNNASGLAGIYGSSDYGMTYAALYTDDSTCTHDLLGYDISLPTADCGGQGWYDLCIAINPADANDITVGGVNTFHSSDGGTTWEVANQWWDDLSTISTVHADKHCLAYNPLTGALFETCDGGIYKTYAPVAGPWTDLSNGICITEFYRNAVDNNVSFCIGGAQDNGTFQINGSVSANLYGGDGMQPLINYGDPANIWYVSCQYGSVSITRDGGSNWTSISDTLHSSGGWVSPYLLHPTDTATLLMAYKQVYMTTNNGLSWNAISPVFDSNSNIDRMVMATTNPNYVYLSYYDYNVWLPHIKYTTNLGATWNDLTMPFTSSISDLVVDPKNENHIMTTSTWYGYSKVWSCNLLTGIWTDETGSLPDIPVDCILIDSNTETEYVGTDLAVFYKDTTMSDWALFNTNLPAVHVEDLHINYATNEIWGATYGRGMWKSIKADHTIPTAVNAPVHTNAVRLFPNPATTQLMIQSTDPITSIKVTDLLGQTVYIGSAQGSRQKIDVSALSPGVYFVIVNGTDVQKFVKQ